MKRIAKVCGEFLTRTAALVSAFGIFLHPANFYRLEKVHALPPSVIVTDGEGAEPDDGDEETVTRRAKKERWIEEAGDDDEIVPGLEEDSLALDDEPLN